jgi:hypothetical protein
MEIDFIYILVLSTIGFIISFIIGGMVGLVLGVIRLPFILSTGLSVPESVGIKSGNIFTKFYYFNMVRRCMNFI